MRQMVRVRIKNGYPQELYRSYSNDMKHNTMYIVQHIILISRRQTAAGFLTDKHAAS